MGSTYMEVIIIQTFFDLIFENSAALLAALATHDTDKFDPTGG